jgi:hypothetical protein
LHIIGFYLEIQFGRIVALFAIEMQSKAVGRQRNVKRQTVGGVEINRPDEN